MSEKKYTPFPDKAQQRTLENEHPAQEVEKKKPLEIEDGLFRARITQWNPDRGYGFVQNDAGQRAFFHISNLCNHIVYDVNGDLRNNLIGETVYVTGVQKTDRGEAVKKACCEGHAEKEEFTFEPTGEEVYGEKKYAARSSKPSEFRLDDISYKKEEAARQSLELQALNKRFHDAESRKRYFSQPFDTAFLQRFGDPLSISSPTKRGAYVVLSYPEPYGDKTVSGQAVYELKHWATEFITAPESVEKFNKDTITIQCTLPDFPGVELTLPVTVPPNTSRRAFPSVLPIFNDLPKSLQERVGLLMQEGFPTAEECAHKAFNTLIAQGSWEEDLQRLQELHMPGTPFLREKQYFTQMRNTWSSHGEILETGGYSDELVSSYFLQIGGKNGANFIREIPIRKPKDGATAMDVLRELQVQAQEAVQGTEDSQRNFYMLEDYPEVFGISQAEWQRRFDAVFSPLVAAKRQEYIQKTDVEVRQKIETRDFVLLREERLQNVLDKIKHLRDAYDGVISSNLAYSDSALVSSSVLQRLTSEHERIKYMQLPGDLSDEGIEQTTQALEQYYQEYCEFLTEYANAFNEVVFFSQEEKDAALSGERVPAQWFVRGVDANALAEYNLIPNTGAGQKILNESLWLPGNHDVVVAGFGKDSFEIRSHGLSTPKEGVRSAEPISLLGVVMRPDWYVAVSFKKGAYAVMNRYGMTTIELGFDKGVKQYVKSSRFADELESSGPTVGEVMALHGLQNPAPEKVRRGGWDESVLWDAGTVMPGTSEALAPAEVLPDPELTTPLGQEFEAMRSAIAFFVKIEGGRAFRNDSPNTQGSWNQLIVGALGKFNMKIEADGGVVRGVVKSSKGAIRGESIVFPSDGVYALSSDACHVFQVVLNAAGQVADVLSHQMYSRDTQFGATPAPIPTASASVGVASPAPSFGALGKAFASSRATPGSVAPAPTVEVARAPQPAPREVVVEGPASAEDRRVIEGDIAYVKSLIAFARSFGKPRELGSKERPSDTDKAHQRLFDAMRSWAQSDKEIADLLVLPGTKASTLNGKVQDLRRRVERVLNSDLGFMVPGFGRNRIEAYRQVWDSIESVVVASADIQAAVELEAVTIPDAIARVREAVVAQSGAVIMNKVSLDSIVTEVANAL